MLGLLFQWLLYALALLAFSKIVPGFRVTGLVPALIASVVIGLLNATVGLFLKIVTFPLSIATLGLFSAGHQRPHDYAGSRVVEPQVPESMPGAPGVLLTC